MEKKLKLPSSMCTCIPFKRTIPGASSSGWLVTERRGSVRRYKSEFDSRPAHHRFLACIWQSTHGKSVTFGVTRGCIAVAWPVSSITWLISPWLPSATVMMSWNRTCGFLGVSIARVSITFG